MKRTKEAEIRWLKEVKIEIESHQNYEQLVKQLNIFKVDGLLRCKGRLQFSELPFNAKTHYCYQRNTCILI